MFRDSVCKFQRSSRSYEVGDCEGPTPVIRQDSNAYPVRDYQAFVYRYELAKQFGACELLKSCSHDPRKDGSQFFGSILPTI